jgi:cytochrome b involved in lipid metabolism
MKSPAIAPIVAGLVIIMGSGALVWFQTTSKQQSLAAPAAPQVLPTNSNASYTLDEVKKHADAKSCWSIIHGEVFDLTSWIAKHPGGKQAILSLCGKDGSTAFSAQHGGGATQKQILNGYKIGNFAK